MLHYDKHNSLDAVIGARMDDALVVWKVSFGPKAFKYVLDWWSWQETPIKPKWTGVEMIVNDDCSVLVHQTSCTDANVVHQRSCETPPLERVPI